MSKEYSEKLKDPRWQKKRLKIFQRDKWTCKICERTDLTLHIHHLKYFPEKEPWEIKNEFLMCLCKNCHEMYPIRFDLLSEALQSHNNTLKNFLSYSVMAYTSQQNPNPLYLAGLISSIKFNLESRKWLKKE